MLRQKHFKNLKRIVVKVGTSVLTGGGGSLKPEMIEQLGAQVCSLTERGIKVILVTSGAIGAGMDLLKLKTRPATLPGQQAAAAIGQGQIMKMYDGVFRTRGYLAAQILLTREDLVDRARYLNARNTIFTLLELGAVPVINENDTVSVDEIKFGDNDLLSSLVANLTEAGLLIILTDVDGLYDRDRGEDGPVSVVNEITPHIESLARGTEREQSVGGMSTKLKAARIVTKSGIPLVIANGLTEHILPRVVQGEELGTLFLPDPERMVARKRWIAYTAHPRGKVMVDAGAREALLKKGRSLLPSGVVGCEGEFKAGDVVSIIDPQKKEFARGLTNYPSGDIEKIKGRKTGEISRILGAEYYDEVIHRNNMVML